MTDKTWLVHVCLDGDTCCMTVKVTAPDRDKALAISCHKAMGILTAEAVARFEGTMGPSSVEEIEDTDDEED